MDDLLRSILNIEIFDMFLQRFFVEEVPLNFEGVIMITTGFGNSFLARDLLSALTEN